MDGDQDQAVDNQDFTTVAQHLVVAHLTDQLDEHYS
jgi:hypothetical protein